MRDFRTFGEQQWRTMLTHTHGEEQQRERERKKHKNDMSRCNVIAHVEIVLWTGSPQYDSLKFQVILDFPLEKTSSKAIKVAYLSVSFGNRKKLKCL